MCPKRPEPHRGYFRGFGGRYVPEMLLPALEELQEAYDRCRRQEGFQQELATLLSRYSGRPTPLYRAENLSRESGTGTIYLKREGLNHTGAHKINNVLGQVLLAKRMGKKEIVAETGAGQHGVATATAAAKFGLRCRVFMGEVDIRRQYPNVYAMKLLGAEVIPVSFGQKTLKDAVNAALKYWLEHLHRSYYLLGSALGPAPYPEMVRDFQSVIGREIRGQIMRQEGRLPDVMVACVGGGSNALGMFVPFLDETAVKLVGVEAGGTGNGPGRHAARLSGNSRVGILQGYKSYFLQDRWGQILPTHSISAGLDYPGVGPELAALHDIGRVKFVQARDPDVLKAYREVARREGIIPALESAHALAHALRMMKTAARDTLMVVNVSGRGDKDLFIAARQLDGENWREFLRREAEDHGSD